MTGQVRRFRGALAALSLAMLLPSLATSSANVALPTLSGVFDAPFRQVQWIVLAYLIANTTLIVSAGRLGDRIGRRRMLRAGFLLFAAASAACGAAPSLGILIVARAAQGLGAAVMLALAMALVREIVPTERMGRAMGLLGTTSAVGTALGPTLGGLLVANVGWRAIFLVNVPVALAAVILVTYALPAGEARPTVADRGTIIGTLRDRMLSTGLLLSAIVSTIVMTTLVVGPFYLSRGRGLDAARVGLVMSIGPVVAALAGVPAGRLVDRLGALRMTMAGLMAMAAASALLFALPATGLTTYVGPTVILTTGYALFQAANNTAVLERAASEHRGVVSALLNLSRSGGLIAGASAMAAVFAFASGSPDIASAPPAAVGAGMRLTFAVATALATGAIALLWSGRLHGMPEGLRRAGGMRPA